MPRLDHPPASRSAPHLGWPDHRVNPRGDIDGHYQSKTSICQQKAAARGRISLPCGGRDCQSERFHGPGADRSARAGPRACTSSVSRTRSVKHQPALGHGTPEDPQVGGGLGPAMDRPGNVGERPLRTECKRHPSGTAARAGASRPRPSPLQAETRSALPPPPAALGRRDGLRFGQPRLMAHPDAAPD